MELNLHDVGHGFEISTCFCGLSLPDGVGVKDNERPPEYDDWEKVERLVVFLRRFYLLTRRISGSLYVTSNRGFFEITAIYDMLNKWEKMWMRIFKL